MKKLFLLSSVSVFFGLISLVFYANQAYAASPFEVPPKGGLSVCEADLAACEAESGVPQTGQTTCWSSAGVEMDCFGTGQDGDIYRPEWYHLTLASRTT